MSNLPLLISLEHFLLQMLGQKLKRIPILKIGIAVSFLLIHDLNQIFQSYRIIVPPRPISSKKGKK